MPRHVSCLDLCGVSRRPRGEVGSSPRGRVCRDGGTSFCVSVRSNSNHPRSSVPIHSSERSGRDVDSLYRTGTQQEMEKTLCEWLHREISRLEAARIGLQTAWLPYPLPNVFLIMP
jgi:hypothetical protein